MFALSDPMLSDQIKAYEKDLHPLALRLVGRDGAEYDDLMQEGYIAIWQCLIKGIVPSMTVVFGRMLNWIRHIRLQNPAAYYEILPLLDA